MGGRPSWGKGLPKFCCLEGAGSGLGLGLLTWGPKAHTCLSKSGVPGHVPKGEVTSWGGALALPQICREQSPPPMSMGQRECELGLLSLPLADGASF